MSLMSVQQVAEFLGIPDIRVERLAREKLGIGQKTYTLEEIYMKYFQEA